MHHDAYADIVDLYDLEHDHYTEDVEFLIELANLGDGAILELGCGSGRILLPLAESGHRVVGVDSSEPMLQSARARARKQNVDVTLRRGDMARIDTIPGGPFGLIIASLNSIMHLSEQGQRRMIETAHEALNPGGRLVIDTLNPSLSQLNHLLNTTHVEGSWTTDDGVSIDKWGHRQPSADPQVIDTLIWYDRVQTDGTIHRTRTRFDLRYIHQRELALLLEIAGFVDVDWYGSYELDPWDAESDRIIVVAHKDNA